MGDVDQDAIAMAKEALIQSRTATAAVRDHERRCLEATRQTNAELVRLRGQQQKNHDATMAAHDKMSTLQRDSVSGLRKSVELRCGEINTEITNLRQEGANLADSSSQKEVGFYRAVAGGFIAVAISLVVYIWTTHGGH